MTFPVMQAHPTEVMLTIHTLKNVININQWIILKPIN